MDARDFDTPKSDARSGAPEEIHDATARPLADGARETVREMSSRWLPPLTALKTFEAVGRAGMAGAAVELNVTPAAINHQIRALEADLGLKLFTRTKTGLVLNKSGREYLSEVAASFDLLYSATRRIKNPFRAHRLVIECLTSFANDFIIPRLGTFYREYPDIELEFRTLRRPRARLDLAHTGAHVAISGGNVAGEWPGLNAERLSHETFFPVCAPSMQTGPNALLQPADLARQTLLVVTGAPEGWAEWLAAAAEAGCDVSGVSLDSALRFDNFHSSSLAAIQGIGIDLGRAPLVNQALACGDLVAPFNIKVRSTASYWLIYPDTVVDLPAFRLFRDWLCRELELAQAP
ncbi:MAG: LysR substrate-binding domain-containing protein [Phenylobacterium sp.]|nr:LysR substrate-binding domain-containing protein [Phenylobacterium sp.]